MLAVSCSIRMNFKAIDSHCHLQLAAYDADRKAVIDDCLRQGLGLMVVGTNRETSRRAVRLAGSYPAGVWASAAIHPGHLHAPHHDPQELAAAPVAETFDVDFFLELAQSDRLKAIGETGLDYYRLAAADLSVEEIKRKQREGFSAHIAFAKERNLPLIMHVRDAGAGEAYADALEILGHEFGGRVPGVMHCFGGTMNDAERCLALGLHLGIGGIITFGPRKGEKESALAAIVREMPADRLLLETDAPYLAPIPLRGERNHPANTFIIAEKVAKIRDEPLEDVLRYTTANAIKLFNLADARPS